MFYKLKTKNYKLNEGMTYIELIVVLAIFSTMSSIIMFNYQDFQSKVEIKSLSNDIALKIVQAQKDAMSGKLTAIGSFFSAPAYGVYFDTTGNDKDKEFIYFADLDNSSSYEPSERLETIYINKKFKILSLKTVCGGISDDSPKKLSILFKRPDSGAVIRSIPPCDNTTISSAIIYLASSGSSSASSYITTYPSGRIQIK